MHTEYQMGILWLQIESMMQNTTPIKFRRTRILNIRIDSIHWNDKVLNTALVYLILILLMWNIGWAPNNVSKWQMGFNSAFKGLISLCNDQNLLTLKNNKNQSVLLHYFMMECKYSETARGFIPSHLRTIGLKKLLRVCRKGFLYNVKFVSILLIQRISQVSFYTR
jgi:hypothetical protein